MFQLDLGNLLVHLRLNDMAFTNSLAGVERKLNQSAAKIAAVGAKMTAAFTLPLTLMARSSKKFFDGFDDAMTKSLAIMSGVTPQIREQMEAVVFDISRESVTTATELARGYFYLASAGLDVTQSMKALGAADEFARAGAFNLAQATSLAMDSQSALGMRVQDAEQNMVNLIRVTDTLTKANTFANANIQQFAEALGNEAGAAMKNWNIQLEEGVAILAAYAQQSVKGQAAGSDFGRLIRLLTQTYQQNEQAWRSLGLELFDDKGFFRLTGLIGDLTDKLGQLSPEAKAATMQMLGFRARTMNVILPLIGAVDQIERFTEELKNVAGYTKQVAEANRSWSDTLIIMWKQLDEVRWSVGQIVNRYLIKLKPIIDSIVTGWRIMSQSMKEFIVKMAAVTAAIGPSLLLMAGFIKVLASLVGMVGMILSPLGLIAGAILYVALSSETAARIFGKSFDSIADTVKFVSDKIKNWSEEDTKRFETFVHLVKVDIDRMVGYFKAFVDYLRQDFTGATAVVWKLFIDSMQAASLLAIELAVRTGKGIWKAVRENIFGETEKKIEAMAISMYKSAGLPMKKTRIEMPQSILDRDAGLIPRMGPEVSVPANEMMLDEYRDLARRRLGKKFADSIYAGFPERAKQIFEDLKVGIASTILEAQTSMPGIAFADTLKDIDAAAQAQKDFIIVQEKLNTWTGQWKQLYDSMAKALRTTQDTAEEAGGWATEKSRQDAEKLESILQEMNEAYQQRVATLAEITGFDLRIEGSYDRQKDLLENQAAQYRQILGEVEEINRWLEYQIQLLDVASGKSGTIAEQLRAAAIELGIAIKDAGGPWYQFAKELPNLLEQGFMRMIEDVRNWKDAAKQMLREVYMEAVRIALIRPLAQNIANAFTGVGSWMNTIFNPGTAGVQAGAGPQITTYAEGGIARSPQLAMVAEKEPEIIIPIRKFYKVIRNKVSNVVSTISEISQPINNSISKVINDNIFGYAEGGIAWKPQLAMVAEKGPELMTPLNKVSQIGGGNSEIHMHYEGVPLEITRQEEYLVSDRRIVDVWLKAVANDNGLRKTVQKVSNRG